MSMNKKNSKNSNIRLLAPNVAKSYFEGCFKDFTKIHRKIDMYIELEDGLLLHKSTVIPFSVTVTNLEANFDDIISRLVSKFDDFFNNHSLITLINLKRQVSIKVPKKLCVGGEYEFLVSDAIRRSNMPKTDLGCAYYINRQVNTASSSYLSILLKTLRDEGSVAAAATGEEPPPLPLLPKHYSKTQHNHTTTTTTTTTTFGLTVFNREVYVCVCVC